MANFSCSACEDLRDTSANFVVNGITDTECTSLQNNTGLNPSSGHDDCTDLNNINDCLVGNMAEEVEAYDVCDWKTFMKKFIPNVWTTLKAIICAICGLWQIAQRIDCIVEYMTGGAEFEFGEMSDDTKSYIVAGKGVSFANVSHSGTSLDVDLLYIAGGLAKLSGSCKFYTSSFTDAKSVYNYDNEGVNPTKSSSRSGSSEWNHTNYKPTGSQQLIYELRIKRSQYPQIGQMFTGFGVNSAGGGYHTKIEVFEAGEYAFGQNGYCSRTDGSPANADSDTGHLVPSGWVYIQMRMTWIEDLNGTSDGTQYTPDGFLGMRMSQEGIVC